MMFGRSTPPQCNGLGSTATLIPPISQPSVEPPEFLHRSISQQVATIWQVIYTLPMKVFITLAAQSDPLPTKFGSSLTLSMSGPSLHLVRFSVHMDLSDNTRAHEDLTPFHIFPTVHFSLWY